MLVACAVHWLAVWLHNKQIVRLACYCLHADVDYSISGGEVKQDETQVDCKTRMRLIRKTCKNNHVNAFLPGPHTYQPGQITSGCDVARCNQQYGTLGVQSPCMKGPALGLT